MNHVNFHNLKDQLEALKVPNQYIEQLEKDMKADLPESHLKPKVETAKGLVDVSFLVKKSTRSENYFLASKYEVAFSNSTPLKEGQHFLVISAGESGKPVFRKFDAAHEAVSYFKEKQGDSELAVGKSVNDKRPLATMKGGKIEAVAKDFQKVIHGLPRTQNIYIREGNTMNIEHAANLIIGDSVFRSNLLNANTGEAYKAWVSLDFDKPKDTWGNFKLKLYTAAWGFDLQNVLNRYQIKELSDPNKTAQIIQSLEDGNRPVVTVSKGNETLKLRVVAVPRYGVVDFYQLDGKQEKRELYLTPKAQQELETKKTAKDQTVNQNQELNR